MKIEHTIYKWLLTVAVGCSALSCDVLDIMQDNQLSVSNMWKTSVQVSGGPFLPPCLSGFRSIPT